MMVLHTHGGMVSWQAPQCSPEVGHPAGAAGAVGALQVHVRRQQRGQELAAAADHAHHAAHTGAGTPHLVARAQSVCTPCSAFRLSCHRWHAGGGGRCWH